MDYVELGLAAEVLSSIGREPDGRGLNELENSVCEVLNQLMT